LIDINASSDRQLTAGTELFHVDGRFRSKGCSDLAPE
jgi:hypothetical protein